MNKPPVSRADAKIIAETAADLADKVLYWKDRALRAEEGERKFAAEVYGNKATTHPDALVSGSSTGGVGR